MDLSTHNNEISVPDAQELAIPFCQGFLNFSKKSSNSYDVSPFTPNKAQSETIAFSASHCDLFMCLQLSTIKLQYCFKKVNSCLCVGVIQLHKEYRV